MAMPVVSQPFTSIHDPIFKLNCLPLFKSVRIGIVVGSLFDADLVEILFILFGEAGATT
jgi:hypothetical protein